MNTDHVIAWGHDHLRLLIRIDSEGVARLVSLSPRPIEGEGEGEGEDERGTPLVELVTVDHGKRSGSRYVDSQLGLTLRYVGHEPQVNGASHSLLIEMADEAAGIRAWLELSTEESLSVFRARVKVQNEKTVPLTLLAVTSFVFGAVDTSAGWPEIHLAETGWVSENRWRSASLEDLGEVDVEMKSHYRLSPRGSFNVTSHGTWSSGEYLPMGALTTATDGTVLWQIEHNGPWNWQVGQNWGGAYFALFGPTDNEHQWSQQLAPAETFETVPVAITVSLDGLHGALRELTRFRRLDRKTAPSLEVELPVVFNDYMNTLMANPTTEKLLPLIAAVGRTGAEYFCVDAGWYSDASGWWDTVGAWEPSSVRFPGGIDEIFDAIRSAGMTPGLWLEPEVMGINSPVADILPTEAFFARHGERQMEDGRYQLDFSHSAVVERMDGIVDGLVNRYGLGYLKFDYNINPGAGTDVNVSSVGEGLLRANRGYLRWLDGVLERHPSLIIENCASGAMRSDWATMSRLSLLSTSDQQDSLRTVPIAVAASTAVLPEQAGVWSYPQPGMSEGQMVVTLVNSMLGRPVLSGHYDLMNEHELAFVSSAVEVYKSIRGIIPVSLPHWPLGLPKWEDEWLAYSLLSTNDLLLAVWHRSGSGGEVTIALPLEITRDWSGDRTQLAQIFPKPADGSTAWDWTEGGSAVRISLDAPGALVLRLSRGM